MAKLSRKAVAYATIGTLLGVLITPLAIRLGAHADGWGIGDPVFLPLLYPYSMLLLLIPFDMVFIPLLILAVCQFPLYGFFLGDAAAIGSKRFAWTALCIGVCHGIGVALCGLIWRFS